MKSAFLLLTVAALLELATGAALWSRHGDLIADLVKASAFILWAVAAVTGATLLVGLLAAVRFAPSLRAGLGVFATTLLGTCVGAVAGIAAPFAALWFAARQWPDTAGSGVYGTLLTVMPLFIGVAGAVGLPLLTLGRIQRSQQPPNPFD